MFEWLTDRLEKKVKEKVGNVSETHGDGGTSEEWVDFEKRSKQGAPQLTKWIEFFENIDFFLGRWKRRLYEDPYYWCINVFVNPRWYVRPRTLKVGQWVDSVERVLHVNMQMVVDYIEKENHIRQWDTEDKFKPWEVVEYEKMMRGEKNSIEGDPDDPNDYGMPRHQWESRLDLWNIYLWWKEYPKRVEEIEGIYGEIPDTTDEKDQSIMAMFASRGDISRPYYDRIRRMEQQLSEEIEENLIKIAKHRPSMWS